MQPLEMDSQNKSMEEKVRNIESKVGVKTQVVIQNENIETIVEQPKAQDVVH